jgi:hypothetical protein
MFVVYGTITPQKANRFLILLPEVQFLPTEHVREGTWKRASSMSTAGGY